MTFAANVRRAITTLLFLWVAGCSDEPPAPNVEFLASDAHFLVAGHHIVVPIAAIQGPGQVFTIGHKLSNNQGKDLKTKAADPNNPMRVDSVALAVYEYGQANERIESAKLCPLLKRRWAQMVCRGHYNETLRRLPLKFDLFDRQKLERLKRRGSAGSVETQYDHVKDMTLPLGVPVVRCDMSSEFCTSAVETVPGMIAVWAVWYDERTGETPAQMSMRQGPAVVEFVRRAIGPTEDITFVTTD
jgi:hypothetical protein